MMKIIYQEWTLDLPRRIGVPALIPAVEVTHTAKAQRETRNKRRREKGEEKNERVIKINRVRESQWKRNCKVKY